MHGPSPHHGRLRATAIGAVAPAMWAALALLTTAAGGVPPFQLTAMTFALAFFLAMATWLARGESVLGHLRQPLPVWALGIYGLFGFHACYFAALASAPPVETSLIVFLWPLLIVLLSSLLPGERLRWWHLCGSLAGFAGAASLIGGTGANFAASHALGYGLAAAAALIWSSYSVASRRFGEVPSDAVGGFCLATALLAALAHLAFERTFWPSGGQWLAVAALGIGPVGAAFFVWDHGVKHGDIRALGALSYATPLLSTLLLIAFGRGAPSSSLALACALIVGGAALAGRGLWRRC